MAWDVIGLANAAALRPGDTLFRDVPVEFPGFISEFRRAMVATGTDPSGTNVHKGIGAVGALAKSRCCARIGSP